MSHPPFLIRLCFVLLIPYFFVAIFFSEPVLQASEIESLGESEPLNPTLEYDDIPEAERADNPKAWKQRGLELFQKGEYSAALESFNRAIVLKKTDPDAWNNKGQALVKLGRDEDALAAFEEAIMLRPRLTQALHNRGAALLRLKRLQEALATYELLIRRNASDAKAWKEKAEVLFVLGRHFEALDAVGQALDIQSRFQEAEDLKQKLKEKIKSLRFNL